MRLKFRPPTDLLASAQQRAYSPSAICSPPPSSPSESNDDDEHDQRGYFGRGIDSPLPDSDSTTESSDAESEGGADSDATLEDVEIFAKIGHPLQRISRHSEFDAVATPPSNPDSHDLHAGHGIVYHPGLPCSSTCSSRSQSLSSVTSSLTDYQTIVDELLNNNPFDRLDPQNFVTYDPLPPSSSASSPPVGPPLMIKRILRDSAELSLLLELNSSGSRQDPWNPTPHILQVIDHDPKSNYLYLCMERLNEYDAPPMSTVAQYIDFFRQLLEGLSFLHEQRIVGMACGDPNSYMVDLSSGPRSPNNASSTSLLSTIITQGQCLLPTPLKVSSDQQDYFMPHHNPRSLHPTPPLLLPPPPPIPPIPLSSSGGFDRSAYPVKYYFVDFSNARRMLGNNAMPTMYDRISCSTPPPSSPLSCPAGRRLKPTLSLSLPPPSQRKQMCPFKKDVQELGTLIDGMLGDMPSVVSVKFKALIKAMALGGFGAEDSRKLFEALCRSLEASVFEMSVRSGGGGGMNKSVPGGCALRVKDEFGCDVESLSLSS